MIGPNACAKTHGVHVNSLVFFPPRPCERVCYIKQTYYPLPPPPVSY